MKKSILILFALAVLLLPMTAFAQIQSHNMDMDGMVRPLQNLRDREFDRAFYSLMIPHHQVAVDMSNKILRTSTNPQITRWASDIIVNQEREITAMTNEVDQMGGIDQSYVQMMNQHMAGMVADTRTDRDYVMLMIPHHQSAVRMAEMAQGRTNNQTLLRFANNIIKTQNREIAAFQKWLNDNR